MNEQQHEHFSKPGCLYALVDFEEGKQPITYIVPSAEVSAWLKEDHRRWLEEDPDHQDNPVRKLARREGDEKWLNRHRERWDLIPKP